MHVLLPALDSLNVCFFILVSEMPNQKSEAIRTKMNTIIHLRSYSVDTASPAIVVAIMMFIDAFMLLIFFIKVNVNVLICIQNYTKAKFRLVLYTVIPH